MDIRLIPLLTLLYLFSFIDRANIGTLSQIRTNQRTNDISTGNANIEGLSDTLGLTGQQYNIALSIFFIPYVLLGENGSRVNSDIFHC